MSTFYFPTFYFLRREAPARQSEPAFNPTAVIAPPSPTADRPLHRRDRGALPETATRTAVAGLEIPRSTRIAHHRNRQGRAADGRGRGVRTRGQWCHARWWRTRRAAVSRGPRDRTIAPRAVVGRITQSRPRAPRQFGGRRPARHSAAAASPASQPQERVLALISGGGSSLAAAPAPEVPGLTQSDLSALYEALLASGADIHLVNAVRKRFVRWTGGRLAVALAPARVECLAVSDIPGDDVSMISSGPCVADPMKPARSSLRCSRVACGRGSRDSLNDTWTTSHTAGRRRRPRRMHRPFGTSARESL